MGRDSAAGVYPEAWCLIPQDQVMFSSPFHSYLTSSPSTLSAKTVMLLSANFASTLEGSRSRWHKEVEYSASTGESFLFFWDEV